LQGRLFHGHPRSRNPHGCRYLVTPSVTDAGPARFRQNGYNVWDLHIWKDSALVFCGGFPCGAWSLTRPGRARRLLRTSEVREPKAWTGPFDFAQGRLRPVPHTGYPKNESAQDPGLSLGTPVEQPSPRTAQTQIRFRAPKRKWPCRASATAPPGYAGELGDKDQAEELEIVKRDGELLRQA